MFWGEHPWAHFTARVYKCFPGLCLWPPLCTFSSVVCVSKPKLLYALANISFSWLRMPTIISPVPLFPIHRLRTIQSYLSPLGTENQFNRQSKHPINSTQHFLDVSIPFCCHYAGCSAQPVFAGSIVGTVFNECFGPHNPPSFCLTWDEFPRMWPANILWFDNAPTLHCYTGCSPPGFSAFYLLPLIFSTISWNMEHHFLVTVLLRYNSHTMWSIHVKCPISWVLVYSLSCATITIINIRTFSSTQKETLHSCYHPTPHSLSYRQPLIYLLFLQTCPILDTSYKWNYLLCGLLIGFFF